jgi:predicted transcriptional regulator
MVVRDLLREARKESGLTQAELARRLGTTQPEIARLEAIGANPRLETLRRVVEATGRRLELNTAPLAATLDETMIRSNLALTPRERLRHFRDAYSSVARLVGRARGA